MASEQDTMPEGTDSIIGGAADTGTADQIDDLTGGFAGAAGKFREEAAGFTGQAAAKVRSYAEQGKDKATDALDGLSKAVSEVAATVDQNIGPSYGDYARRASDAVAALATDLRDKSLDDIYEDAQKLVRSSPAIAIGTAAAVGFALVRLMKSGIAAAEAPAAGATAAKAKAAPVPAKSKTTAARSPKKTGKPAA